MRILFTEVEPWEQKKLKKAFTEHELFFTPDSINQINITQYNNIDILSIFVHSKIDKVILEQFPHLKLIVTRSTGTDHIDMQTAKQLNIQVHSMPLYASQAVAEYTFALLLSLARKIHLAYCQVQAEHVMSHKGLEGFELKGKTIGIIGLGNIGKIVGHIAAGFDMHILACDQKEDTQYAKDVGCSYTNFQDIITRSDILTFHLPLTPQTYHLLNKETFHNIKKGAYIVNTARGGIIETPALLEGLNSGQIAGAALDVLENENDMSAENKALIEHPNVIVSPHNAFNTQEARNKLIQETINAIKKWISSH